MWDRRFPTVCFSTRPIGQARHHIQILNIARARRNLSNVLRYGAIALARLDRQKHRLNIRQQPDFHFLA